ncbi:hypothetical protein MO867_20540 [Microbulbifer sp. OS29]|uniref:Uncharacterized protein n=2 Tax=Microbulbifer okhotskensis TaxID=2926617 RepID=A0A9X2J7L2_9GAMM|nr:hypothetical protein [Microbulbifer okhotskensis]MCO1336719.1 hypothetical protein [Microbulbifer okhotskensis]
MQDFSLQGKVYLGERLSTGKPGKMHWVNDVGLLNITANVSSENRQESYSGQRLTSATLNTGTEVSFSLTLYHATASNLAMGLYGTERTVTSSTVTDEAIPEVEAGDSVILDRGNISSLVITDSNGTPATLVDGTNYQVTSSPGGVLEFLDVTSFTQPFNADYSHGASTDITMFTESPPVRYLMLDGVNTVDGSGERVRGRLYKCKFNPVSQLDLINSSFGELALTGTALFDALSDPDEALGGFGRIELLG